MTARDNSDRGARAASGTSGLRSAARVLVVSDNASDVQQIVEQLRGEHDQVLGSSSADAAAEDFQSFLPQVVVMAFDAIQKSDRYLLTLYRHSEVASRHCHRTVLLTSQAEAAAACSLCKKGCYDDYVLYWPMAQDGLRLSMSVWNAAQAVVADTSKPNLRQLSHHADLAREVDSSIGDQALERKRLSHSVTVAMDQAELDVGTAIDEFAKRQVPPSTGGEISAKRSARFVSPRRPIVMVVDDDEVQRELISAALEGRGYEVVLLGDGASLIGAIRRRKPDLILLDINLPDGNGVDLARVLRGLPRFASVPILMMTGDASRDSLARSIDAGAVGYILKPFARDKFLKDVDRLVASSQRSA